MFVMYLNVSPFLMYCRISLFAFSIAPFCHDEYGSVKQTGVPSFCVIYSCAANYVPLSVVMVFTDCEQGESSLTTSLDSSSASLLYLSFETNSILVFLSTIVSITSLWFFSTIVSISKSLKRVPSASLGLSCMHSLFLMQGLQAPTGLFLVLHSVSAVLVECSEVAFVLSDYLVDGFMRDVYAIKSKHT